MRFIEIRLVGPAIAGIAVLIAGLAAIPYYGVSQVDAQARARQEMLVEHNIGLWTKDIEFSLTAWTVWDEAIANLDNKYDPEWTDRNIGASLTGTSRTRFVAVLKADDSMLYTRTDDRVKDLSYFKRAPADIVKDASDLVAQVRRRETEPKKPGIPDQIANSRIEVLGDEAVLLTAALFQPDFGTAKPKGPRAPVLITAMPIAGSLQNFFGDRFLLDDARISPLSEVSPERSRTVIATEPDGRVEVLSWLAPTPAADIMRQSMPLIIAVSLVLIACAALALRFSRATARALVARERAMRHAATHDFLTGLSNRALLYGDYARMQGEGALSVVCLDLDGFKGVNDTHGHATGDALLKAVAERLKAGIGARDHLFRLGGDEFTILMPGTGEAAARDVCSKLGDALRRPFDLPGCCVTIGGSFGICEASSDKTTCDEAMRVADLALYAAKARGRTRLPRGGMAAGEPAMPPEAA